jgi:hypothetical protein
MPGNVTRAGAGTMRDALPGCLVRALEELWRKQGDWDV